MLLFASNPALLILGMNGALGKEAKEAAEDMATVLGIVAVILLVAVAIALIVSAIARVLS